MPLLLIDLIQFIFKATIIALPLLFIALTIYIGYKLIRHKAIVQWQKVLVVVTPLLFIIALIGLIFINPLLADMRYDAWTKKCGHEPVIVVPGWFFGEGEKAYTTLDYDGQKEQAYEYFCTLEEAKVEGYLP